MKTETKYTYSIFKCFFLSLWVRGDCLNCYSIKVLLKLSIPHPQGADSFPGFSLKPRRMLSELWSWNVCHGRTTAGGETRGHNTGLGGSCE